MGYTSYLSGEITIYPSIPWKELQGSPFVYTPEREERDRLVWLRMAEETVETDDGTLTRKQAVAIRVSEASELRAYGLVSEVQEIVTAHGTGRSFDGLILVCGEASPDIWRVRVVDGHAVEERPMLRWPDGTEEVAQR
ncbi:hypothetical protein C1I98_11145 [Spongiactinospora gelatinilytica]|uniref:Uncharacterized protein n=1 Tax=Spongiactinospora gelatinilytica TaxID=2666298 RepID=A0A2W2GQ30_9ACTN|nr:DUF6205 family protein [Spongiactinospora gelatinilytica]PZG49863.1 hypothetical protein C1I98_11145 [Spongiactinospora gelatinilytica]